MFLWKTYHLFNIIIHGDNNYFIIVNALTRNYLLLFLIHFVVAFHNDADKHVEEQTDGQERPHHKNKEAKVRLVRLQQRDIPIPHGVAEECHE